MNISRSKLKTAACYVGLQSQICPFVLEECLITWAKNLMNEFALTFLDFRICSGNFEFFYVFSNLFFNFTEFGLSFFSDF